MKFKSTIITILAMLGIGCSEYYEPIDSDMIKFKKFISSVDMKVVNENVNIYKPNDNLFKPLLAIQRQKLDEAEEELKPLVEKGDPEAMFWMAKIIYRSSIKDTPKALALLKESAKTNPYAAMALFPDNEQCQMYFPRECNEKWVEQAKILFSEDAKKGDVRAIFYSKMLKEDHDVYVDAIIEAAKMHYYYPLVDYSNYILNDKSSNVEMKNLALSLLNYARVNNFIPAIDSLIHFYENNEMDKGNDYIELIKQGVLYGSNYAWNMNETLFRINDKNSNMDKYIKGKALYDFNGRDIGLSFVKFINNNKELALANKKAQEMVDAVKDVIYIDGAHPRQD